MKDDIPLAVVAAMVAFAVLGTALAGGSAGAAYIFLFLAVVGALLYEIWPELRDRPGGRRGRLS